MKKIPRNQRGAALFVGLIFLLVLTILGLTAAKVSTLDERMAGNFLRQQTATQMVDDIMSRGIAYAVDLAAGNVPALPANAVKYTFSPERAANTIDAGTAGEKTWQGWATGQPFALANSNTNLVFEQMELSAGQSGLEVGSSQIDYYFRITAVASVGTANTRGSTIVRQMIFVP